MNRQSQKKNRHLLLKLISLIAGFFCWYIFMHQQNHYRTLSIPVCFHDLPKGAMIKAPEIVEIDVRGKKFDLEELDQCNIAFNIDARSLTTGCNSITLSKDQIFLPDHVSLLNYTPSTILVYMHEQKPQEEQSFKDHLNETTNIK